MTTDNTQQQQAEAARYAWLLDWGTRLGVLVLLLSFSAYLFGVLTPHIPVQQLPEVWNLPLASDLEHTHTPKGWNWLALAGSGDVLNLVGISLLIAASLSPLLGLIPLYLQRRDYAYAAICSAVLAVLVLAASGILTGGH